MGKLFKGLLNLIYPPRCLVCGCLCEDPLCDECFSSLPLIEFPICLKCGKPCNLQTNECRECRGKHFRFSLARAAGLYDGNLREAIHRFKYHNGRRLAPVFAQLMISRAEQGLFDVDLITYVPLSKGRERKRGFNQSRLLAEEISLRVDKPCEGVLIKAKETVEQNKLSLEERRKNVRGVFSPSSKADLRNKTILLIDDVLTTGATVNECSKILLAQGANGVNVLTIARSTIYLYY